MEMVVVDDFDVVINFEQFVKIFVGYFDGLFSEVFFCDFECYYVIVNIDGFVNYFVLFVFVYFDYIFGDISNVGVVVF